MHVVVVARGGRGRGRGVGGGRAPRAPRAPRGGARQRLVHVLRRYRCGRRSEAMSTACSGTGN